jgi:hypothetical protein
MRLLLPFLILFCLQGRSQDPKDPKIDKYNREIDSLKGVYRIPTAMGYTKTIIRDEKGIRETMILFYRKGNETEEVILWTKQLGSKDSIIILGQLTVNAISTPKDSVIVKPKEDCPFGGTGISVYSGNRLFGILFDSHCQKRRFFLLKEVVPNKKLFKNIDEQGVYVSEYLVPIEWWNSHTSGSLTQDQIQWIREHFKSD